MDGVAVLKRLCDQGSEVVDDVVDLGTVVHYFFGPVVGCFQPLVDPGAEVGPAVGVRRVFAVGLVFPVFDQCLLEGDSFQLFLLLVEEVGQLRVLRLHSHLLLLG